MKTAIKMRTIALFGMLVIVMSFGIQTASAGPLGGGDSFENATQIYSGHSSEAGLDEGDEDYFYIMVNAGQMLVLEGSIVTDNWGAMRHSIHEGDKSPLNDHSIEGTFESNTILWSPNSEKDSYKFYTRVECVNNWRGDGGGGGQYNINVSIEDRYDANSGTDAGNTFDTAMNITPGSYDGFLSGKYYGDQGTDNKDLYKLSLEAGDTINVKLTPPDDVKLQTTIYNEDREKMNSTESPETGVITRSSWTAPYAQNVYVLIERGGDYPSGTYSLDIVGGSMPIREKYEPSALDLTPVTTLAETTETITPPVPPECERGYKDCYPPWGDCETNIFEDNDNCGDCGIKCPDGYFCLLGSCVENTTANKEELATYFMEQYQRHDDEKKYEDAKNYLLKAKDVYTDINRPEQVLEVDTLIEDLEEKIHRIEIIRLFFEVFIAVILAAIFAGIFGLKIKIISRWVVAVGSAVVFFVTFLVLRLWILPMFY